VFKRLVVAVAVTGLITSPVAASTQAPPAPVPAQEEVNGMPFLNSSMGPVLLFLLVVVLGTTIALLVNTKDEPSSP
jgi:hypothetical protein